MSHSSAFPNLLTFEPNIISLPPPHFNLPSVSTLFVILLIPPISLTLDYGNDSIMRRFITHLWPAQARLNLSLLRSACKQILF